MTDECEYLKISLQRHNIDLENHGTLPHVFSYRRNGIRESKWNLSIWASYTKENFRMFTERS